MMTYRSSVGDPTRSDGFVNMTNFAKNKFTGNTGTGSSTDEQSDPTVKQTLD